MQRYEQKRDIILSIIIMLISVYVYFTGREFTKGAEVFPIFLSGAIFLLSTILLIKSVVNLQRQSVQTAEETGHEGEEKTLKGKLLPYIVFLMIVVYVLLIPVIGFFTISTLFIIAILILLGVRKVLYYILTLLILIGGIYFLFVVQLKIPIPRGFLI